MSFDANQILSHIIKQRKEIDLLLANHGSESILTSRVKRLCRQGCEGAIVQLALVDDCLAAIESALFSLNGSRKTDLHGLHSFLKPAAKLYAKKDPKVYLQFTDLHLRDCESFVEAHYTDLGPFGGANRRTRWSGFHISMNASSLQGNNEVKLNYRSMIECVVRQLLDRDESINDVLELRGLWSALTCESLVHSEPFKPNSYINQTSICEGVTIEFCDFGNCSVLFDVYVGKEGATSLRLNSSHVVFKHGHPLICLLQAWAQMECMAWDRRKQLLEDIRSDWGRAARDLVDSAMEVVAE